MPYMKDIYSIIFPSPSVPDNREVKENGGGAVRDMCLRCGKGLLLLDLFSIPPLIFYIL